MKARNWGLIAAISALFLTLLAIPAISNSDNSDNVSSGSSQSPVETQTPTQKPDGDVDPSESPATTPSADVSSTPTSPELDPKSDKEDGIEISREFLKRLIGMNESDARTLIYENNYMSRVVHRDGEDFMVTADYRYDRVNLYISGGIVFDATAG